MKLIIRRMLMSGIIAGMASPVVLFPLTTPPMNHDLGAVDRILQRDLVLRKEETKALFGNGSFKDTTETIMEIEIPNKNKIAEFPSTMSGVEIKRALSSVGNFEWDTKDTETKHYHFSGWWTAREAVSIKFSSIVFFAGFSTLLFVIIAFCYSKQK